MEKERRKKRILETKINMFFSGDGSFKIIKYSGEKIYYIDKIPTIITSVLTERFAKGYIVDREDFSLYRVYIAKFKGFFAHEKTLKEALESASRKYFYSLNIDQRIEEFLKYFEVKDEFGEVYYKGETFFKWHNTLTGSCLAGRNAFVKEHDLDLNKFYTVEEFIKICENAYGGEVIKKLKEKIKEREC